MDKKYFFFDIDRTLGLGITGQVPADTQYCVDELQQQGHFVALATGRLQCDAAAFAEKHGIHSMVADGRNGTSPGPWCWTTPWTGILLIRTILGKIRGTT